MPNPRGIVKADGTFALGTYGKEDGAPPGEYVVTVQWFRKANSNDEGLGKNVLPAKYADAATCGINVRINEGENRIPSIDLKR